MKPFNQTTTTTTVVPAQETAGKGTSGGPPSGDEPSSHLLSKQQNLPMHLWQTAPYRNVMQQQIDHDAQFQMETRCISSNHYNSTAHRDPIKKPKSYSYTSGSPDKLPERQQSNKLTSAAESTKFISGYEASSIQNWPEESQSKQNIAAPAQIQGQIQHGSGKHGIYKVRRSKQDTKENAGGVLSPNGTRSSKYDRDGSNQKTKSELRRFSSSQTNNVLQDIMFEKQQVDNDANTSQQNIKNLDVQLGRGDAERRSSNSRFSTHVSGHVSAKNQTNFILGPGVNDQAVTPLEIPTETHSFYNDQPTPCSNIQETAKQKPQKNEMIGSDVKPIQMQETTEKDSSRPMSSMYVDDADEEDEDEDNELQNAEEEDISDFQNHHRDGDINNLDGGMTPRVDRLTVQMDLAQRPLPHTQGHLDRSKNIIGAVNDNQQHQGHVDSIEQPFQKISVEEAINSKDCQFRMQTQPNQEEDASENHLLMNTVIQNGQQDNSISELAIRSNNSHPRIDMETGEVYSSQNIQSRQYTYENHFRDANDYDAEKDRFNNEQTSQGNLFNDVTMYEQNSDLLDHNYQQQHHELPRHFDTDVMPRESKETTRDDEEYPIKLSHRYRTSDVLRTQQQSQQHNNNNLVELETYTYDPEEENNLDGGVVNPYNNRKKVQTQSNSHNNSKHRQPCSSNSFNTPSWNPYTQQQFGGQNPGPKTKHHQGQKGTGKDSGTSNFDSCNSIKRLQRSKQRQGRNGTNNHLTVNAKGCRNGIHNITRGSMGASSGGGNSLKSLHNASPLTYLMKDTKVLDSEKIREPVLRQKYQQKSNSRNAATATFPRANGTSLNQNSKTTNAATVTTAKVNSSRRSLNKSKSLSNNISASSLKRDRNLNTLNVAQNSKNAAVCSSHATNYQTCGPINNCSFKTQNVKYEQKQFAPTSQQTSQSNLLQSSIKQKYSKANEAKISRRVSAGSSRYDLKKNFGTNQCSKSTVSIINKQKKHQVLTID